jgi:DNA-binding NarL/FixJ family response regulator
LAPIRILVVDYFEPWRRTIRMILEECQDWHVICEALDGLDAVQKSRELQPDIVLLEVGLPKLNGIEAARQIRKVAPNSKIIFFSDHYGPELVREALKIGRWGYILKSDAAHDLVPALKAVIQDKRFVSRDCAPSTVVTPPGTLGS